MSEPTTLMAVGERDGKVVFSFPHPTTEISFDSEAARNIAEQVARSAYKAHYGRIPINGSPMAEVLRIQLRARARLVLRTLLDEGKSPDYIAAHLVDVLLAEVL